MKLDTDDIVASFYFGEHGVGMWKLIAGIALFHLLGYLTGYGRASGFNFKVGFNAVATTLALAEQHNCLHLKAVCLKFVALPENLKAVMQTEGFEYLKESCPGVLTELLQYVARIGEHSVIACGYRRKEAQFDGSDVNGRRVKPRLQ
ncbi:hypothetical protein V6N12_061397 [Hibiscus sabdariffa]|uniref:BPM/SPOP BACK domain-containing protein n=1 Tax=Hibiscus sabdariffa TaxID=183260 RepID=A0ABR2DXI5_9ROSI